MRGTARAWGLAVAAAGLALDQLHKVWMLGAYGIEEIRELIVGRPQPAPEE